MAKEEIEAVEKEVPDPQAGSRIRRSRGSSSHGYHVARRRSSHQVLAAARKRAVFAVHLEPDAPERVVGEKLDNVAGREELVADGELAAIARRLALLAHLRALVAAVEELVHPADGLVLAPHRRELGGVQDRRAAASNVARFGQSTDAGSRRSKSTFTSVESSSKSALDVEAIAGTVRQQRKPRRKATELAVAGGLLALA